MAIKPPEQIPTRTEVLHKALRIVQEREFLKNEVEALQLVIDAYDKTLVQLAYRRLLLHKNPKEKYELPGRK